MKNILKVIVLMSILIVGLFADTLKYSQTFYTGVKHYSVMEYKKSKEYFEKSIKKFPKSDIESYFYMAILYKYGRGVKKDHKKAFELYKKGAELGDASAQFGLAESYRNGEGVDRDTKKAVYWFEKAIAQGNLSSMANIGIIYYNGEGEIRMNKIKAYQYWSKCAKSTGYHSKAIEFCQKNLSVLCSEDSWACK